MLYFLLFLLVLFLILVLIPIKFDVYYEFTEGSKYKITITYLFGIIKKEIDSTRKDINKKKNNEKNNEKKSPRINTIDLVQYIIDKGDIRKLSLSINLGFVDPSILGFSIGLVWAIINIVFAYFFYSYDINRIEEKEIQVIPKFNEDIFQLFFSCIIKVNLVYIIIMYIRFLKIRKGGDSIARTSNRRTNENYND